MDEPLLLPQFISAAYCATLRARLDASAGHAATVQGMQSQRHYDAYVRRATQVDAPTDVRDEIVARFDAVMPRLAAHFDRALSRVEAPQFLRYRPGDFFVAHQDGNTPLVRDGTMHRKVSIVLLLSEPADHDGGDLVLHRSFIDRFTVPAAAGTLVAFRSEVTHEVTPLVAGERFTIASWCRDD